MSTKRSETRGNSGGSAAAGSGVLSAVPRGIVAPLHSRGSWPLLWLAFGALTVLLIIVGVVSVRGLRAIAVDVDLQADVARPRSDAARELELNVLDYGLGVRTYVAGDAESRERANGDARGVADSLAKYEQLVETPQQRELATRFTDHWQSFHTFGETLMAAGTASPQELMRLASLRLAVVKVLDDEMQPDAVAALDARRAATQTTLENTEAVTLLLLIGGVLLALVTSGVVVRAVVRSEIALRDSEERLKLATAVSGIGIWDWNLATDTLVWDDALLAMYGARREDFSGTHEAWTTRLHPDDKAASDAAIEDALSGKKAFATEFRVIWPDGSVHHLKASGQVIRDEVGKPLRMVGTNLDVTERELRDRNRFFLADIQKVFAPLATESDLVRIACGRIAEHLELVHCSVVEVRAEADQCTVLHDCHAPGTPLSDPLIL